MIIETFRNFIEIDGLRNKIAKHIAEIAGQEKRLIDTLSKKQKAISDIESKNDKIKSFKLKELELSVADLEKKVSHFKEQMNQIKTQKELDSLNHEIKTSSETLAIAEKDFFEKIDIASKLEKEISDLNNFLTGIDVSITEIKSEVQSEIIVQQKEIDNFQLRINSLLDQVNPSYKKMYLELSERFKSTSPTAFINGKNCSVCRINIDAQTINLVDHAKSLELCPNCGRILLPNNLNLY